MNKLRFLFLLAVSVFSVPLFTGCLAVTLVGFAVLSIDEQFMTESDGGSYGEIVYRIDFSHPDDSRMTEQNRRILIIPAGNPGNMLLLEETDIYRDGRLPCVPC